MEKDVFKMAKNDEVTLKVVYDTDGENPRDWDNLGTMVCWHSGYSLGDKHDHKDTAALFKYLIKDYENDVLFDSVMESDRPEDMESFVKDYYTILPLYLYDHSGLTMNTSGFSCSWDSGQVGWIYCSREKMEKETGYTRDELFSTDKHRIPKVGERVKIASQADYGQVKSISGSELVVDFDYNKALNFKKAENIVTISLADITEVLANRAEEMLKGEVETFDQHLRGDVYGFVLETNDGDHIDSCYGFYGDDFKENGMMEHIPDEYKELVNQLEAA